MISAQGLTKFYGDKCAVEDLSFEIGEGEIVGILGLNGAGKTTTLRILACLLLPSTGTVHIGGVEVTEDPHAIRKKVGFLPEEPPLYREMTVDAYLRFAGELRGLSRSEVGGRLAEVAEQTNIADVRGEVIANLSHGYRQRVGIAQAMIHKPQVLILDEPISGLDPVQIVEMRRMIRGLKGQHTVLVSSHILPEISQTCDRLLVIQNGRLAEQGTEEELTSRVTSVRRLMLHVRGAEDKVLELVNGISGVTDCQVVHGMASAEVVRLLVQSDKDLREELSAAVVGGGLGLLSLMPAEPELESTFLQLTSVAGNEPAEEVNT